MNDADDKTASLLAALWLRNLPLVEERLALLDRAAATIADAGLRKSCAKRPATPRTSWPGRWDVWLRRGNEHCARDRSAAGRRCTRDAARFSKLVAELRRAVFPEALAIRAFLLILPTG